MDDIRTADSANHQTFADRVGVHTVANGTYLVLPASIESVVSFNASYLSIPAFSDGQDLIRDLAVSMYDKGTRAHTKLQLAELLEDRGAQIGFYTDGLRVRIAGRALREDIPLVLQLVGEQLHQPLFHPEEFGKLKERYKAAYRRSLVDTGALSQSALSRHIYATDHPNYIPKTETELEHLSGITINELEQYHEEHRGLRDWKFAIVGDISWPDIESVVTELFGETSTPDPIYSHSTIREYSVPARDEIHIADRDNIDVRFGHSVPITRLDDDFLPLTIGTFILGGNFSARLMNVVRDQMGLTYGIHSSLSGFAVEYSGMWGITVTLSRENLDRGMEATLDLVRQFVDIGVTVSELEEKQQTITGSFKVDLSTTGNLAESILRNAERGRDAGYFDRYPDLVREVQLGEVNDVIRRYLDPNLLHIAMSGSLNPE